MNPTQAAESALVKFMHQHGLLSDDGAQQAALDVMAEKNGASIIDVLQR